MAITYRNDGTEIEVSDFKTAKTIKVRIDSPDVNGAQSIIQNLSSSYPTVSFTIPVLGADDRWHAHGHVRKY